MIATAATARPAAVIFARVLDALSAYFLAGREVGAEHSFMTFGVDVSTWVPAVGALSIRVHADADGWDLGPVVRTVTVCPGEWRAFEVVASVDGRPVIIDECRTVRGAISAALDYATRPARARVQHDHDAFAV